MNERVRPGDRQPSYRRKVVVKGREAAKIVRDFDRSMKSISRNVGASPDELRTLERRVLEMAERPEVKRKMQWVGREGRLIEIGTPLLRIPGVAALATALARAVDSLRRSHGTSSSS